MQSLQVFGYAAQALSAVALSVLRLKTDGSNAGPRDGKPVIAGNGMRDDRASVVFSRPEEASSFMRRGCP